MPLALDFTSTLVMGSIFPVATTLCARSPFSTLPSFEGSIFVLPLVAAINPTAIKITTTTATPAYIHPLRFFLLPFTCPPAGALFRPVGPDYSALRKCFCFGSWNSARGFHFLRSARQTCIWKPSSVRRTTSETGAKNLRKSKPLEENVSGRSGDCTPILHVRR